MIYITKNSIMFCNKNNKFHRIGGPAVIRGNFQGWYINRKLYTKSDYYEKLKEMGYYDSHHKN